jgi:acetolactate synthase I/II/III large subunit
MAKYDRRVTPPQSDPESDQPTSQTMSGGEAIVRSIVANGIDTVFGIPGAQIYPLFDALHRLNVRTVFPRHEQAAAYMAMGAANSTGKPACFAVVPGPGILNTTAALCTAMGTCSPVLGLTGQVPTEFYGKGRGHLHELRDQAATLRSIVKDARFIADAPSTSSEINAAFTTMLSGRQGPVTVEMCWDTMAAPAEIAVGPGIDRAALARPVLGRAELGRAELDPILDALRNAKRPMIMCGKGAQASSPDVQRLAELLGAPVAAFRSGRGVVSEDHTLGVSSLAARLLYEDVDVVLGLGSRMEMTSMRWATPGRNEQRDPNGPTLIRVDIEREELERYVGDLEIVADVGDFCRLVLQELTGQSSPTGEWGSAIADAKLRARTMSLRIQPQVDFLDVIREVLPRDGFFVPELSQMGFTSYFAFPVLAPRTYVTEGFQGTLGFGFPTALGVKVANPDRAVVSVTGDGGFLFGLQELATARAHNIALVTLVFNNHSYGNVRRDQVDRFGGRLAGADLHNPDFVKLSESFGVSASQVTTPPQLRAALSAALETNQPWVIEVETEIGSETNPWDYIHMKYLPEHLPEH